jgi:hypothetical protein
MSLDPRTKLVTGLIEMLDLHGVVHIRGTPATGKTELLRLVHLHLCRSGKSAVRFTRWPVPTEREGLTWEGILTSRCRVPETELLTSSIYILVDEAQSSYYDVDLWNDGLKSVAGRLPRADGIKFLMACSYGSPGSGTWKWNITPQFFPPKHHLSLLPTDKVPLGLFLTDEEFRAFVDTWETRGQPKFALDLRQRLRRVTSGHIGALVGLLEWISTSTVCTVIQVFPHLIF